MNRIIIDSINLHIIWKCQFNGTVCQNCIRYIWIFCTYKIEIKVKLRRWNCKSFTLDSFISFHFTHYIVMSLRNIPWIFSSGFRVLRIYLIVILGVPYFPFICLIVKFITGHLCSVNTIAFNSLINKSWRIYYHIYWTGFIIVIIVPAHFSINFIKHTEFFIKCIIIIIEWFWKSWKHRP